MRASGLLLLMMLFPLAASAEEKDLPSMELLEFLGEWDKAEAGWVEQQLSGWMVLAAEAEGNEESNDEE